METWQSCEKTDSFDLIGEVILLKLSIELFFNERFVLLFEIH